MSSSQLKSYGREGRPDVSFGSENESLYRRRKTGTRDETWLIFDFYSTSFSYLHRIRCTLSNRYDGHFFPKRALTLTLCPTPPTTLWVLREYICYTSVCLGLWYWTAVLGWRILSNLQEHWKKVSLALTLAMVIRGLRITQALRTGWRRLWCNDIIICS